MGASEAGLLAKWNHCIQALIGLIKYPLPKDKTTLCGKEKEIPSSGETTTQSGESKLMGRGGAVPGGVQNHVQKEFPPSKKDDIEILHTETLVKEVDRVFRGSHLDPLEMDMAEKVLKDQEQALIDAIESLDSEDDSKILKTRTQHTSICDKAVKTKQSCNKLGQILEWATTQNGIGNKTLDDIELFHTDTLVKEVERVFRSHPDPLELDMAIKVLKNQEQALIDAIESLNSEDDSKILKFNQPEPGLGKLERRGKPF